MPNESAHKTKQQMKTESKNKTGNGHKNATAQLADINAQIESLKQQRIGLSLPLQNRHAELRGELLTLETEIRELDPSWKSPSLRPKVDDKIIEVIG
jgi:hypothetical protein